MGVFSGEIREKGCLMSGAAARTGKETIRNNKKIMKKWIVWPFISRQINTETR